MKDSLDILSSIKQVETPDFLETRILQNIENAKMNTISKPLAWTLASFSTCCLVFTLLVVSGKFNDSSEDNLAKSLQLTPSNYLYGE